MPPSSSDDEDEAIFQSHLRGDSSSSSSPSPPPLHHNFFAPPFYNRPPTPLPPSPSLTSLLRPSRPTTPDSSADELEPVPRASPKVPTYEYYGFVLYLFSSLTFLMYLLWSYLPSPFLHALGIYYYPNRWWSLALPSFLVMLIVYIYVALASYNIGYLTLPMSSIETIIDDAANIATIDGKGRMRSSHKKRERMGTGSNVHDWRTIWSQGTDAVMDVPLGGVCEVLYGDGSIASAQKAIKTHSLPSNTKTYDNPTALAADPNVDLIVVSVNVATHYDLAKPALEAGKDVFVEWPLGRNLKEAEELAEIARAKGGKTWIGLQARFNPGLKLLRSIIDSGKVGRIMASSLEARISNFETWASLKYKYFAQSGIGGDLVSIYGGHMTDAFATVLGEFKHINSLTSIQRPTIDIMDGEKVVEKGLKRETADHIFIQGTLVSGAVASLSLATDKPFPGSTALVWNIHGDKGQLLITAKNAAINIHELTIKFSDYESGNVEDVEIPKDAQDELPQAGKNVGRSYAAYATGEGYPTFEDAVLRHRLVDAIQKSSSTGQRIALDI
ncbi:hypothetical protein B7494_g3241 [Chlorociboria aeruginascens]|nr:hypothetical protein B7494_g3241 [Chlorociboria aeruginascens]